MRITPSLVVLTAFGVALVVASCDKSPTRPSPQTGTVGTPTPVLTGIEIVGPASVEPGGSAQLSAMAVKSDGSKVDVTRETLWSSTNNRVLWVSPSGVATAVARGEANIVARYQSRTGSASIMVLPQNTFRLAGRFTDTGIPLPGVHVEVISGTGSGLTAVTNDSGAYALYGVAGQVTLQAKKEAYRNQIQNLEVTDHRMLDLEMMLDRERVNLAGSYTLEIEQGGCADRVSLPLEARARSYTASVEQEGPRVTVRLSGADFITTDGRGDHFSGLMVDHENLRFEIGGAVRASYYGFYYYYYFDAADVVERFGPSQAFLVVGTVDGEASPGGISGLLRGWLVLADDLVAPFNPIAVKCYSSGHRFEMRRR